MNMVIASFACIGLLIISFAHFAWALGSTWPIRNEALLAKTVTGFAGVEKMPSRWLSLAVAVFTLAASIWVLALADHDGGGWSLTAIGVVIGLVFTARGILGYTPGWKLRTPEEPFRTNDIRVYSPLCLIIGIGTLALVLMRLS